MLNIQTSSTNPRRSRKLDHARLHGRMGAWAHGRMGISFRSLARHCSLSWDISISYFGLSLMSFPWKARLHTSLLCSSVSSASAPTGLQKLLRTESCTASSTHRPKVHFFLLSQLHPVSRENENRLQFRSCDAHLKYRSKMQIIANSYGQSTNPLRYAHHWYYVGAFSEQVPLQPHRFSGPPPGIIFCFFVTDFIECRTSN